MDSRPAPSGAGNSGGVGSGFSFFTHFSPLSSQQRQAAHEVLPGLFLGSALAARSASWLHQNGITHILCLHNAAATPAVLQEQLQQQLQLRREILKCNPEREPGQVQHQQHLLQQLQQKQLAHHLAVHPDRYVYCCCHAIDTPQALILPLIPFCIDFIDKALSNRNYRLHPPDQRQLDVAAAAAAAGTPQHNVRLLQSRRRNHCFIEKGEVVDAYSIPEDAFLLSTSEDATGGEPCEASAGDKKAVGGRVLVHCAKGISRSACIVLAYLMYRKCLRLEDALAFLCLKRPVYPNVGFQVQLQYLQERMEDIRPALPHAIEQDSEQLQQQQQKGAAAGAAAAHAFEAAVTIEKSEPDIFRRDPEARNRLRSFVASCSRDLDQAELERRIIARIGKECTAVDEQVALLYKKAALLQQRSLWRAFGLFFENLRSYQLQQEEAVLRRAEESAQKAAELKLVFAATLPGVSMADKVADEIKTWVSDSRATAAAAAETAAAEAAAAEEAAGKAAATAKDSKDKTPAAAIVPSEVRDRDSGKLRDRDRKEREREERRSRRSTSRGSSSSRHSSTSSGEKNDIENAHGSRDGSHQPRGVLPPMPPHGKHRSSSKGRDRDRQRDKARGRDRDSSNERRKRKRERKAESKKKEKKKKHSSLKLNLKAPKSKPEKRNSSDSE